MKEDFYIELGKKLKYKRNEEDKKQWEIANILHTSRSNYSRYELGIREISFEELCILADLYNVSLDFFAGRLDF